MYESTVKMYLDGEYKTFEHDPDIGLGGLGLGENIYAAIKRLSDPENGDPAYFEYYESGQLSEATHYKNGRIADSAFGEPAIIKYDQYGNVIQVWSDTQRESLSIEQADAMFKAAHIRRVEAAIAKLDQSVIPAGMRSPEEYIAAHAQKI